MTGRHAGLRAARSIALRIGWVLLTATGSTLPAQGAASAATNWQRASRAELAARLQTLEAQPPAKASKARVAQLQELADLRARLQDGDFHVGDRFVSTMTVDAPRTDTLVVRDGLQVAILNLPELSLKGVLRAELSSTVLRHVSRYVKNVQLRTVLLTQVSVVGAVGRPGFYWAAPDRPLSELVMLAGGPVNEANLTELEVMRNNRTVVTAKASRDAIARGATLEQVDIRSGDEVRIPLKKHINWQMVIQVFFIISSVFFAIIQFLQWYYSRQE